VTWYCTELTGFCVRAGTTSKTFYLWRRVAGRGQATFIRLGRKKDDLSKNYGDVTLAGVHTCRYCMPYENDLSIFLARQRQRPIEEVWGEAHSFH
jgi:hypothetical protein